MFYLNAEIRHRIFFATPRRTRTRAWSANVLSGAHEREGTAARTRAALGTAREATGNFKKIFLGLLQTPVCDNLD